MSKFIIERDARLEFRWRLQADNYKNILHASEGYTSKQNCLNSIASVRVNSQIDERYRNGTSISGQYYFTLHSYPNGETLGISEMYTTSYSRDEGKKDVKREAKDAKIEDRTPVTTY